MRLGRTFVHPAFDVLIIGGVLSVPFALAFYAAGLRFDFQRWFPILVVLSGAHVAASLIRLYSQEGVVRRRPILTVAFPLSIAVAAGFLLLASGHTSDRVDGFYVSWSSYHYAAQTYGIALMYAYRSGTTFSPGEKRLFHVTCLATFVYALLGPGALWYVVPPSVYVTWPALETARRALRIVLFVALAAGPLVLAARKRRQGQSLPLMSLVCVYTNALFWVVFVPNDAFVWAALSHGVQYLGVATYFHVKASREAPNANAKRGAVYHSVTFYLASVGLAFGLYYGLPPLYEMLSYDFAHSGTTIRIALLLNFHHVIIDGFIWKRAPAAAPATAAYAQAVPMRG
jgi:hypothetical protein